ncbi:hypothetical protein J2T14_005254 [Paenibacillus harenae]|nr:hypothetical protein [Paenibacillus harenae]
MYLAVKILLSMTYFSVLMMIVSRYTVRAQMLEKSGMEIPKMFRSKMEHRFHGF